MGTLLGHAIPGFFFLLIALWRLIQIVRRQQLLKSSDHQWRRSSFNSADMLFYNSATYPCYVGECARWPMEGSFKVVMTLIGMCGELWASTDYGRADHVVSIGDIQHVTMYSMFFLSGVVDLVVWCCPARPSEPTADSRPSCIRRSRCCTLTAPPGVDLLALSFAFIGEALMFSQHTHGRHEFDQLLHYLLICVLASTVLSVLAEGAHRLSLTAALLTTYLLFVQGTWFIQIGLLLYPPKGSLHQNIQSWLYRLPDHDQTLFATMIVAWHLVTVFVLMLLLYVVLHKVFPIACQCCTCSNSQAFAEYTRYKDLYLSIESVRQFA